VNIRLGYLYSRYPLISQTFCDMEMLALERLGWTLEIGSIYSPLTSLRHEHISRLRAPVRYAPPQRILQIWEKKAKASGQWPAALVDLHERKYGQAFKPGQRARNALYFADLFTRSGVAHFRVHFANRAAHTALFVKEISGIPFSVTAHGQDFMTDLGNDELLREICAAAEFVAAVTGYSRDLLRQLCPESAEKIHLVYNGLDLEKFLLPLPSQQNPEVRILSVGRLVAFKGFDYLIEACAELARRGGNFVCEIVGDGPLHENLRAKIDKLNLSSRVALIGSLSQEAVLKKLRSADVFALASVVDDRGGSDVFPTVILEAMAAARPVVSTRLAGIPESVVHEETGLLVSPGDTAALADALERLLRDPQLRLRYGNAGRARMEQHFEIKKTVVPLVQLLQSSSVPRPKSPAPPSIHQIAYLIDRWPDKSLPFIERELDEMTTRNIPIVPFVCELDSTSDLVALIDDLTQQLEFLPDAMAIESEWRANRTLTQQLEEARAQEEVRSPDAIFLRQARFALALRKLLLERNISHVHATSSRALVCALILQSIVDLTVSATIEPKPELPQSWIEAALRRCEGGRLSDRRLLKGLGQTFLFDRVPKKIVRLLGQKSGIDLTKRANFWQEWSKLLARWSRERANEEPKTNG
jgi:glycosyltransferase involved in cell wall biosynthesis